MEVSCALPLDWGAELSLLLKNGTVITASAVFAADVFVRDGKVVALGRGIPFKAERVVDVSNKYVLPGGVDVHTHLDMPSGQTMTSDDFASGTVAAAVGGTTTIVDYAMQKPGQTLPQTIELWQEKASGRAVVDYGFHLMVCDPYDGFERDLRGIVAEGVTSLKVFMAFPGSFMIDDGQMLRVMAVGAECGARTCVHAESGGMIEYLGSQLVREGKVAPRFHPIARPPLAEVDAVNRAIGLSAAAKAPVYFVHLSTSGAAEAVARAQLSGLPVSGETCTHYLTLDSSLYDLPDFEGAKAVMSPPLRRREDGDALWRAVANGVLSIVSSDHCPFNFKGQKEIGRDDFRQIPSGAPGIESRMILLYGVGVQEKRLTLTDFVRVTATNPAVHFGMHPRKGDIAVGSDADIVVLDPSRQTLISAATQRQHVDYSLWEGWQVPGFIDQVYLRGRLVVDDGAYVGGPGGGEYVARASLA